MRCARSVSGSLYQSREIPCEDIETPRPSLLDGAYSISFRLYIQTIREGRVTGWRETLSGGIVSSLSVPLSMVGEFPSGSGGYR